jgi:hypothetical protein
MHAKIHLAYLQIHFQIYHLLGEDSSSPLPELLDMSAKILETVVQLGISCRKGAFTFNDLPLIVRTPLPYRPILFCIADRVKLLSCGLPSAAVLSTALENITQDPSRILPPGIKTSAVIRNLSVLASQLESVASSRERNQAFCLQAAKAITEKLDKILDKFATSKFQATPDVATSTGVSPMSVLTPSIVSPLAGGAGEIGAINLDDYENFDLMSWAIDFDLGNTASDWTMM